MPRSAAPPPPGERIAKLLARAGVASRREVERMIAEGRVARDGVPVETPATILSSLAGVTVDGAPVVAPAAARLFLYHKPVGLLVTERDPSGRPTIYDRLPADLPRLVPVGRLDLNTEGLLLLTTDGGLKRQLELPASGVERTYRARAYGQVTQAQLEALIEGVEIEGVRYGSIDANLERRTGANVWIELTLTEGKNREVRRVLEHLGLRVGRLIRVRYGPFVLGDLPANGVGEVRERDLTEFRRSLEKRERPVREIAISAPTRRSASSTRAYSLKPQPGDSGGPGPVRSAPKSVSRPALLPGEGRGPVAKRTEVKRPLTSRPSSSRGDRPAAPAIAAKPDPGIRRGGPSERSAERTEPSPRPAKPQRKAGWAKPKPRSGPGRPKPPRR